MSIAVVIDKFIAQDIPFVCWKSGGDDFQVIIDQQPLMIEYLPTLNTMRGFVFAPFEVTKRTPIVLLRPEIYLTSIAEIKAFSNISSLPCSSFTHNDEEEIGVATDFTTYETYVNKAINALKKLKFSKVVLSKVTDKLRGDESMGDLFLRLQCANPQAFVYIINLPNIGLWLGATPETLFRSDGNMATIMSLAGTQPLRNDHDYYWRAKEIEEQAFVSRYAVDTLNRYGIQDYQTVGPEDCETSAVTHLKTTFSFLVAPICTQLGEFIADLSPTPAVCGLPREGSKQWIMTHEAHQRNYYTGFLGMWRLQQDAVDLFVNIRCLQVFSDRYRLYTGGGITAKSTVQAEWEETEYKAATLLSVIEDLS